MQGAFVSFRVFLVGQVRDHARTIAIVATISVAMPKLLYDLRTAQNGLNIRYQKEKQTTVIEVACRRVPLQAWKGTFLTMGVVCGSLQVLYRFRCRKGRLSIPKWNPKGTLNNKNGGERDPK